MPSDLIRFRQTPGLQAALDARVGEHRSKDLLARQAAERYFAVLPTELAGVHLQRGEALLLCDVLNGTSTEDPFWTRSPSELLALEVDDSGPDGMAEKWEVDLAALVAKIRSWSRIQALAVIDAVERWWTTDQEADADERLVAVGLHRPCS